MSEYPEALLEKVAKAISPDAWEPEAPAHWKEYARDQAEAALDAIGLREDELWTPVGVNGERWGARRKAEAEQVARDYPRDWTYAGEEDLGPNGIDHLEGERRLVFESEWEPIRD
jgi:hypothetical protein